jgi:hypothetical protein
VQGPHWPYAEDAPAPASGKHHNHHADAADPSDPAHQNALLYVHPAHTALPTAQFVRETLDKYGEVALALRVLGIEDQDGNVGNNWLNVITQTSGLVLDPALHSPQFDFTTLKFGHAVCVLGYEPDQNAPGGGWFIFRNSCGEKWGEQPAVPGGKSLPPGYGTVSAEYVDKYALEAAFLA